MLRRVDRGAELGMAVRLKAGETWRPIRTVECSGGYLFGTLPDTAKAQVELVLRVPGKALGRSATVDDLAVSEHAPMVREGSPNLYWDGSFETDLSLPPDGWAFWVNPPKKVEFVSDTPRERKHCLRIHGDQTYPVLPVVPVQPRRLYRLSYRVRGEGTIYPGLHKLGLRTPDEVRLDTAVRIGWAEGVPSEVRLKPDAWQQVEYLTPCEDEKVIWFQPYFVLRGGFVDVGDVEMRSVADAADRR